MHFVFHHFKVLGILYFAFHRELNTPFPHRMQKTNYIGMNKSKIPNFSGLYLVPSKMHNLLPLLEPHEALLGIFFCLSGPKSKIENSHIFTKIFTWCLVSLCKVMDQNPKFFRIKGKLNTPLTEMVEGFCLQNFRFFVVVVCFLSQVLKLNLSMLVLKSSRLLVVQT